MLDPSAASPISFESYKEIVLKSPQHHVRMFTNDVWQKLYSVYIGQAIGISRVLMHTYTRYDIGDIGHRQKDEQMFTKTLI
jgi:hypothetical protein